MFVDIGIRVLSLGYVSFQQMRTLVSPFPPAGAVAASLSEALRFPAFTGVGSEVAHRVAPMLATVRRSNCTCGFPACSFHEDSCFRDAIEGIS
jgi:hypothetical protein